MRMTVRVRPASHAFFSIFSFGLCPAGGFLGAGSSGSFFPGAAAAAAGT